MATDHGSTKWKSAGLACAAALLVTPATMADFMPPRPENLVLWVDATQGVMDSNGNDLAQGTTGGAFVTWQDQSGNGNHLTPVTAGNNPRWTADATTSTAGTGVGPLVDMRASSLNRGPLAVDLDTPFSSDAVTVFAIHNSSVASSWSRAWEMHDDGDLILSGRYGNASSERDLVRLQDEQAAGDIFLRAQDSRLDVRTYLNLFTSIANGADSEIHFWAREMTGSQLGQSGNLPSHGGHMIDRLVLGDAGGGSSFQAFIVYDTILTAEERRQVEAYLATQFSIPEPGSLGLLGSGGLAMLIRRRQR